MRETALFARVRPRFEEWGTYCRIENTLGSGTWDLHYCFSGQMGWVETKIEHGGEIMFEKFQLNWGKKLLRAGATNMFVLTGSDESHSPMSLYHAKVVMSAPTYLYKKWTVIKVQDLVPTLYLSKPYDWAKLKQVLSNPFTSS